MTIPNCKKDPYIRQLSLIDLETLFLYMIWPIYLMALLCWTKKLLILQKKIVLTSFLWYVLECYAVVDLFCPLHTILLKIIYIVKQLIRIKPSEEYSALKLENSEISGGWMVCSKF